MADGITRRVWVLGAGFSRPLGGPLLDELLTPGSDRFLREVYPGIDAEEGTLLPEVLKLFAFGTHYKRGKAALGVASVVEGAIFWADAEEFLEVLDLASTQPNSPTAIRLWLAYEQAASAGAMSPGFPRDHFLREVIPRFSTAARRLVAGACAAFLHMASPESEKWSPYREWAKQLDQDADTIISFNFDRVVERVFSHLGRGLRIIVPNDDPRPKDGPVLLKLHGCVAWSKVSHANRPDRIIVDPEADRFVKRKTGEFCLGTPGPGKLNVSDGMLADLWRRAGEAVKQADVVVFVGYRFPPSDALARESFADWIRHNDRQLLNVRTVLGEPSPDSRRVVGLLRYMTAGRTHTAVRVNLDGSANRFVHIADEGLWSQDFLSLAPVSLLHLLPARPPNNLFPSSLTSLFS